MITPRFSCSQDTSSLTISLHCPAVRASEAEIAVDGSLVTIHVAPYFLRLHLPGSVLEDDASSASYDPSPGTLTVVLTKETPGQNFPDLDLLAKLLAPPPREKTGGPGIEVLSSEDTEDRTPENELVEHLQALDLDAEKKEILEAAKNDWRLPQSVPSEPLHTTLTKPYGFLNSHLGYFSHAGSAPNEVNELGADAETLSPTERRRRRITLEDDKFDPEHYAADFADHEHIQELVHWTNPYTDSTTLPADFEYTEDEKLTMLRLPRKEYLVTPDDGRRLQLTLLSLLFGYAYDARTTQGDPTSESAWTICTLVPAFAALDPPDATASAAAVLATSYRRALAYPLFRSWALCEAVRADVADVLGAGKRPLVRCLLDLKRTLDAHEVYYVYAKIWIDDMLVWAMAHLTDETIAELAVVVRSARVEKAAIEWEIEEIEAAVLGGGGADSDDESAAGDSDDEQEDVMRGPMS